MFGDDQGFMHFLCFVVMLAYLKVIVEKDLSVLFINIQIIINCKSVSIHFSIFLPSFVEC